MGDKIDKTNDKIDNNINKIDNNINKIDNNIDKILRIYNPTLKTVETYRCSAQYATLGSGRLADISVDLPSLEWEHLRIDFDSRKIAVIGSGVSVDGQNVPQGTEISVTNDSIIRVHSLVLSVLDTAGNPTYYNEKILEEGIKNPRPVPSVGISHCQCIIEDVSDVNGITGINAEPGSIPRPSPFNSTVLPPMADNTENSNDPVSPPIMSSVISSNPMTSNVVIEKASIVDGSPRDSKGKITENVESHFNQQTEENAGYIKESYMRVIGDIAGIGSMDKGMDISSMDTGMDIRSMDKVIDKITDKAIDISSIDKAIDISSIEDKAINTSSINTSSIDDKDSITKQLINETKKEILEELKVEPKDELVKAFIDKKIAGIKHDIEEEVNGQGNISVKKRKNVDLGKVIIEKDILEEAKNEVKEVVEDMDDFKNRITDNIKEEVRETMNDIVQGEVKESIGNAVAECLKDSNMVEAIVDNIREKITEEVPVNKDDNKVGKDDSDKDDNKVGKDDSDKDDREDVPVSKDDVHENKKDIVVNKKDIPVSKKDIHENSKIKASKLTKTTVKNKPKKEKDSTAIKKNPIEKVIETSNEEEAKEEDVKKTKRGGKAEVSKSEPKPEPPRFTKRAASVSQVIEKEEISNDDEESEDPPAKRRSRGRPKKSSSKTKK
ncbi:hypothetical protein PAEPH01_1209 [Pancytospora epiphaga]|nr:hypothetical protein PAEPH01_1209 [Pancytospora epiphaga]